MENKWPGIVRGKFMTEVQKETFFKVTSLVDLNGQLINESVLSQMRDALDTISKDGQVIDEKMLDKLREIMKSASGFSAYLDDQFKDRWDRILSFYKSTFDKPKEELLLKYKAGKFDFSKDGLDKEMEKLKELVRFWLKDMRGIISDSIRTKYSKCLLVEATQNTADVVTVLSSFHPSRLNEGKDIWSFLDKANVAITATEPFKSITKIADINMDFTNKSLNAFGEYSKNLGAGDSGKFVCLGQIASKLAELRGQKVDPKEILKTEPVLRFMPAANSLIGMFEVLACTITAMEFITEIKK